MFTSDDERHPVVVPQRMGHADHADPNDVDDDVTAGDVARHAATLLPAVLWLLGVYVFGGAVPVELQGAVGLLITALCTVVARLAARAGLY